MPATSRFGARRAIRAAGWRREMRALRRETPRASDRDETPRSIPVHGHDAGAADADIVLQRHLGAFDLARLGPAAQLLGEFIALRQTRGADGMSLGQQPAGGIDHVTAAKRIVAVVDKLRRA